TFRPCLELLENRLTPSTFIVDTALDSHAVDPSVSAVDTNGHISLRSALEAIEFGGNRGSGPAVIHFHIDNFGSQQVIRPQAVGDGISLPPIFTSVIIDGLSQGGPGYQGPPLIQIDGSDAVSDGLGASGILIAASDVTVQGLVIS